MTPEQINLHYKEVFSTISKETIKPHIQKIIESDVIYPFNSTFFCITNTIENSFEYVSKNFCACTGIDREEMIKGGMAFLWSLIHPEDIDLWMKALKELMQFTMTDLDMETRKKMSYTWNYRIKNGEGRYVNVIQNTTPIQFDEQGKPVYGLAHYTVMDNSHKMDICASAKYLNANNVYETLFYSNLTNHFLLNPLSERERDIVRLLVLNHSSIEIGKLLSISKHTVDTHRRNILKKMNVKSTETLRILVQKHQIIL